MQSKADTLSNQSIQTQTGLPGQQADIESRIHRNGNFVTVEQVLAADIEHAQPPEPISEPCGFCGKTLWRRGVVLHIGQTYRVSPWLDIERCDCDQAQERWRQLDTEKADIKRRMEEAEVAEARMREIVKLITNSGMGRRYVTRQFETFEVTDSNRKAYDACWKYANTFTERREKGEGLYLSGPCGTGKTHLAASIANALIIERVPVVLLTVQRILDCIKDTYGRDGDIEAREVLGQSRRCSLLILDDFGKEQPTGWAQSEIYRIVNDRYEQMAPVIVTTNYDDDGLIRRLSSGRDCDPVTAEAIVSRLHEMTFAVPVIGADRRKA